jgi:hypothetical protein
VIKSFIAHPFAAAILVLVLALAVVPFLLPWLNKGLAQVNPKLALKPVTPKAAAA